MMNEKRSVLKILEDAKHVSYAIAVMLVTSKDYRAAKAQNGVLKLCLLGAFV